MASTMAIAHLAGVRVFVTGGIGGVHRWVGKRVCVDAWFVADMILSTPSPALGGVWMHGSCVRDPVNAQLPPTNPDPPPPPPGPTNYQTNRGAEATMDVSADLIELGRIPHMAVVCAGVKSILDIPKVND